LDSLDHVPPYFSGQAQAADSDEAHPAADKRVDTSVTMPAAQISHLEKFVRHFAALDTTEAEATLVR